MTSLLLKYKQTTTNEAPVNKNKNINVNDKSTQKPASPKSPWKVSQSTVEEIRRSANKYVVLEEMSMSDCPDEQTRIEREIVSKYVDYQREPSMEEFMSWNANMHQFYKEQWVAKWKEECPEIEDVYDEVNGIAQIMTQNVLDGKGCEMLH